MLSLITTAALGGLLRLLYGGAPHYAGRPGWLGKGPCYLLFVLLGILSGPHVHSIGSFTVAALVALAVAAIWNPGHGSYLNPGNGSPDNEDIAPIVRLFAFGAPAGSVWYCCAGMGLRYGMGTLAAAIGMSAANYWGAGLSLWFAVVGFLACPVMLVLWATGWTSWARVAPAWLGPQWNNGAFEFLIGAAVYGGYWAAR